MSRVSEAVARPARTGAQLGAGAVLVEFYAAFWAADWSNRQYLAAVAAATLLVGFAQVLAENRLGGALLRAVPPRKVPAVDRPGDAGVSDVGLALIVLFLLVVLLVLGVIPTLR